MTPPVHDPLSLTEPLRTLLPTITPTSDPTQLPTTRPTIPPTPSLTVIDRRDELPCFNYSNQVTDLISIGVGSSCRGNINETWPGGRTCDSPYIICLPKENTPAMEFLDRKYFNETHRYSVAECKEECALDQRCLGFEFVPDIDSSLGDCNLIDDIPIKVVDEDFDAEYNPNVKENLYADMDGNTACFAKQDYCNPHFTSEELSETMLTCYCPNNRKGSYTKKVKRTINNTRSCGGDDRMDERIRYAQANRMFHLCENWGLFNTLNPALESWYWDPWKSCWRESYAARGEHRGYCDRVIRNPNSIELKFVTERSKNLLSCDASMIPTQAPVSLDDTSYFLGLEYESCDEACSRNNATCAANQTAVVFSDELELLNAFQDAGHECDNSTMQMNNEKFRGWALPALKGGRVCINRVPTFEHLEDLDSDCIRVIGKGWQRLCACVVEDF